MTNEEAIEVLDDMKAVTDIPKSAVTQLKRNKALNMAIEALGKQIPKKPAPFSREIPEARVTVTGVLCPVCKHFMTWDGYRYCSECGQKLFN